MHVNSPEFTTESLFDALTARRIQEGKTLIEREQILLRAVPPGHPSAPRLFYVLVGWGEYSKIAAQIVREFHHEYTHHPWPTCSLRDWGWIVGGNVLLAMYEGKYDGVDEGWQWLQDNASKFDPPSELLSTVDLAKAHARRKCANYPEGLDLARLAIGRYREVNLPGMVAVAQVLEGWLLTQLGKRQEASQAWSAAFTFLQGTEDWTLLGNILSWQGRDRCRADFEEEGRILLLESAALHERLDPPHRNLRHIYTDLADLELRMASKSTPDAARELRHSAGVHIKQAEALLEQDHDDYRNRIRLFIAQANHALLASNPNFHKARLKAQQAYELAQNYDDRLMMARALYKRAVIEKREAEHKSCADPIYRRLKACRTALTALELAGKLHSDRLAARIHTLLSNLFLDFPFCDPEYAIQHCEAAVERMKEREDFDYVAKHISALGERLGICKEESQTYNDQLIITVSEELAFEKGLEEVSRKVERAIILAAVELVGANSRAIAALLGTGRNRIDKILDTKNEPTAEDPQSHRVIFRVKTAFAFSRPLQSTIKAVQRAIILAGWIRYGCDRTAVKDRLHIGFEKVVSALGDH